MIAYDDFKSSLWHELAEAIESIFKIVISKDVEIIKSEVHLINDTNSFNPNFLKYLDNGYTINFDNNLHFGFFFPYPLTEYCMTNKKYIIASLRIKLSQYLEDKITKSTSENGLYKVHPDSEDRIKIFTDYSYNEELLCMSFPLKAGGIVICYIDEKHVRDGYNRILDKMDLWKSWSDFFKDQEFKDFMCEFLKKNNDKINPNFMLKIFK